MRRLSSRTNPLVVFYRRRSYGSKAVGFVIGATIGKPGDRAPYKSFGSSAR